MFFLILTFVLFGLVLWIHVRPTSKPFTLPRYKNPVLSNRNHIKDLEQARISPNDMYMCDSLKRDTLLSGAMGMSSRSVGLRSPATIHDHQIQTKLQAMLRKANTTGSEQQYQSIQKEIKSLYENHTMNTNVLTKHQIAAIKAAADGQEIPTVVEGDSLEDNSLSLSEFKQMNPHMNEKPRLFNFAKFSIQTKPGSAETLMEKAYQ